MSPTGVLIVADQNALRWHDDVLGGADYDQLLFIDRSVHPAYLRLVETPFHQFLHLPAVQSRVDRGKGPDRLDIFNVVEELERNALADLCSPYRHVVRNAIAHGRIRYGNRELEYVDRGGKCEKMSFRDCVALFDALLDTCNGVALALKVFLTIHRETYSVPKSILLDEVAAQTETPWWKVIGWIPSTVPPSTSQLIIYAQPRSDDRLRIHYSAFQTAVLAELLAPSYDRYFISMRSRHGRPGFASFYGNKIKELRRAGPTGIEDYGPAAEVIYFVPRFRPPAFIARATAFWIGASFTWKQIRAETAATRVEVVARHASIHRNGWGGVVLGAVVVRMANGPIDQATVRAARHRILRAAVRLARASAPVGNSARYLPVGYARIAVFCSDHRRRCLASFGLGEDLIATVQTQRMRRIRSPDLYGSEIEHCGRYRIAWNRAWLDARILAARAPGSPVGAEDIQ
ncbi:MAG: hypothetical protein IPK72_10620 [Candidatus Eisenbacteria bacterium]|nr:hypothetical protein [Candidatus Eisenbacteria bacterium]